MTTCTAAVAMICCAALAPTTISKATVAMIGSMALHQIGMLSTSQEWLQSKGLLRVFDRDLTPSAGRKIFQFEGAVLNASEPGHFVPQRLKQSADFTVLPLDQDHFQM